MSNETGTETTETTKYEPLTLGKDKGGSKYGTVVHGGKTYEVKIRSTVDGRFQHVMVVNRTGDLAGSVYMRAGLLLKEAIGRYLLVTANAEGYVPPATHRNGHTEQGTIAACAERVVHAFLQDREHAAKEAAKTPEQKAAEAAQAEVARNAGRNRQIAKAAQDLLDEIDKYVPDSTVHYAVEETRRTVARLIREANNNTIKTAVQ
jgi:hypothetical protein